MIPQFHLKDTMRSRHPLVKLYLCSVFLSLILFLIACDRPEKLETLTPEEAAQRQPFPVEGRFLLVGSTRVFYRDTSPASGPLYDVTGTAAPSISPIVLIHGLGASTFSFRRNIPELSRHARVVALDLKGFGFSKEYSDPDVSFQAQADVIVSFLDALRIPRANLVGHSLGGSIAALVAAQHPERVDRLVLIDSATLYITRPFVTRLLHGRFLSDMAYQLAGPDRKRVRKLLEKSYVDKSKVSEADVDGYCFPFTVKNSAESLRHFLTASNRNLNVLFSRIQAPTLILWGAGDTFLDPSVRDFLGRQIKNSSVRVIEGAGHAVMEEKPEEVNKAIMGFLAR